MPDDNVALLAFLASAAALGLFWWWGRRVDARSRERYEIVRKYMAARAAAEAGPLSPAGELAAISDALQDVLGDLEKAQRLLEEVYSIGLWSKSDDCSDNRRKREGMRETDWAVSGAYRALRDLRPRLREVPETLVALEQDLAALVAVIEPLPDTIIDTMLETPALDVAIRRISDEITRLSERASQLAAEYDQRITPEQVQPS